MRILNGLRTSRGLGGLSLWYLRGETAASGSEKMPPTRHFKSYTVLGNSWEVRCLQAALTPSGNLEDV